MAPLAIAAAAALMASATSIPEPGKTTDAQQPVDERVVLEADVPAFETYLVEQFQRSGVSGKTLKNPAFRANMRKAVQETAQQSPQRFHLFLPELPKLTDGERALMFRALLSGAESLRQFMRALAEFREEAQRAAGLSPAPSGPTRAQVDAYDQIAGSLSVCHLCGRTLADILGRMGAADYAQAASNAPDAPAAAPFDSTAAKK